MEVSFVGKLASTDDVKSTTLRYYCMVVCSVIVSAPHLEIFEPKSMNSLFSCDWIKSCQIPILEVDFTSLVLPPLTIKLLHRCCYKLALVISKPNSFFFLFDQLRGSCALIKSVIRFGERLTIVLGVCTQLNSCLVGVLFGSCG